jgi:hypothetical protein
MFFKIYIPSDPKFMRESHRWFSWAVLQRLKNADVETKDQERPPIMKKKSKFMIFKSDSAKSGL